MRGFRDIDELKEHCETMGYREETEADAMESLQKSLRELFDLVPWQRGSTSAE